MKFSCDKNLLFDACMISAKAVPPKSSLPVLEGLLLNAAEDGKLTVSGFDLEIGIETYLDVNVTESGSIVVAAKMFSDILRSVESGEVFISTEPNSKTLSVVCGVTNFKIQYFDSESYPEMPYIANTDTITLKQSSFLSMLRQSVFAMAVTDSRVALTGALFEIEENEFTIVCTNTFKLAIRRETIENGTGKNFKIIVPGKILNEILRMISDSDEDIRLGISDKHIIFEYDNVKVISRLIDGNYLNYKGLIPENYKTNVHVKAKELKKPIERASILLNDEKVKIPVKLSFVFDSIIVTCRSSTGDTFTDEIGAAIDGANLDIGFNNKYLLDVINACDCDDIVIHLNSPLSSMSVCPEEGNSFIFMVSPMKIKTE